MKFEHIEVRPIAGAPGAELSGVDTSRPLSAALVKDIRDAHERFLVIFFRDQALSLEQLKSFSTRFGELTCRFRWAPGA